MKTVRLRGVLAVVGLIITVVGCNGGTDPVIDPIVDPVDPPVDPVEREIRMTVTVTTSGITCKVTGPMLYEPGTSSGLLQGQTKTIPLGTRSPGEIVDVYQTFSGGGCFFHAMLWADQTEMVFDSCQTGGAECVITLQGVVP